MTCDHSSSVTYSWPVDTGAGVVDQHVDGSGTGNGFVDDLVDRGAGGQLPQDDVAGASQGLDLAADLLGRGGVAPVDDDVGARLGEGPREDTPESSGGTGHQRRTAGQGE